MKVGTRYLRVLVAGWAATSAAASCAFPNYGFEDEVKTGIGGRGTPTFVPGAGSSDEGDSGGAKGEGGNDSSGGSSSWSVGGEGGAPQPDSGGSTSDGGEAGSPNDPPVIKVCADFESFPADCQCFDYREHAYLYCSVARPWTAAGFQCGFHGMRLIAVDDVAENTWLANKVGEITQASSFQYFWIGASSEGEPVVWSWPNEVAFWKGGTEGAPIGSGYAPWRGGNPDAGSGACAFMGKDGWEDGGCTDSRPYACESY